jgi:asparagine synthase (glutamine-hydrolysing)
MCGIAGIVSNRASRLESALERMLAPIAARGPDGEGSWYDRQNGVAFGHRRLAIIDLSPSGHQPMESSSHRFVTTFNGEIYNFQALRAKLESEGVAFRGTSDTEVMLAIFERDGVARGVSQLSGMFAAAIYDRRERVLHLIRDRFGEKPLFYGWAPDRSGFLFGSDPKSIYLGAVQLGAPRLTVSRSVAASFLKHSYVPAPYSIFDGIYKLVQGTHLELSLADCLARPSEFSPWPGERNAPRRFWSLGELVAKGAKPIASSDLTFEEATDQLDRRMRDAVRAQMVADVPVGAFLSGGIDSSCIVAQMQRVASKPVETFSIGFTDTRYDEASYARAIAKHLGTVHHEQYVSEHELLDVVPKLGTVFSEPFADSSQIPTFLVAQLARARVTVSLSGDGGDELFAGYSRFLWAARLARLRGLLPGAIRSPLAAVGQRAPLSAIESVARLSSGVLPRSFAFKNVALKVRKAAEAFGAKGDHEMYDSLLTVVPRTVLARDLCDADLPTSLTAPDGWPNVLSEDGSAAPLEFAQWCVWADTAQYLPDDILVKVDRCAMAHGLETRVPFLDYEFVEFVYSLPIAMRGASPLGKPLLKAVLERYVPRPLFERPKMGFSVPLGAWLRGPLKDWVASALSTSELNSLGVVVPEKVHEVLEKHQDERGDFSSELWNLAVLHSWFREHRDWEQGNE